MIASEQRFSRCQNFNAERALHELLPFFIFFWRHDSETMTFVNHGKTADLLRRWLAVRSSIICFGLWQEQDPCLFHDRISGQEELPKLSHNARLKDCITWNSIATCDGRIRPSLSLSLSLSLLVPGGAGGAYVNSSPASTTISL